MYGEGRNWRYLLGIGVVIVLLFVVIFMIVRGGNDSADVPETKRALTSYANDSDVTITQTSIGPVVAAQDHDEVQIRVTNSMASIDIIKGYDGNVVNSRSYPVSSEAFSEFLHALEKAGYTEGNTDKELKNDEGYCPTGTRFIFEIFDGSNSIQRFWTTTCDRTKTYKGDTGVTLDLFRAQIPEYEDLTGELNLPSNSLF